MRSGEQLQEANTGTKGRGKKASGESQQIGGTPVQGGESHIRMHRWIDSTPIIYLFMLIVITSADWPKPSEKE